jgi:ABC-type Fe3+-hydroxamate transport system substrate-binding protein
VAILLIGGAGTAGLLAQGDGFLEPAIALAGTLVMAGFVRLVARAPVEPGEIVAGHDAERGAQDITAHDMLLTIANVAMALVLLAYYWTPWVLFWAVLALIPLAFVAMLALAWAAAQSGVVARRRPRIPARPPMTARDAPVAPPDKRRNTPMPITRRHLAGLALAALPLPAFAQTRRVTDALGREVGLPAEVRRPIVTFNYEEFTAIAGVAGWSRLVGMNRVVWEGWRPQIYNRYLPLIPSLATLPDVGNTDEGTFSAEKVVSLRPDLLIVPSWIWAAAETARAQIMAAGIPIMVIDYNAQLRDTHIASTRAIGAAMGTEARAEELAERYRRNHDAIMNRAARAAGATKPRAYIELGQGGAEVIGASYPPNNLWGRIFDQLGAANVAAGRIAGAFAPIPAEAVIAGDPTHIFIGASSWVNRPRSVRTGYDVTPEQTRASLAPYAQRPGWAGLTALRANELHAIEHGLCRTLFDDAAILYIAKRFYPGAFEGDDPVAVLAEYHRRYLPVSFSGTWMLPWRS